MLLPALALAGALCLPRVALADVTRYAVVIGHNDGRADEPALRYAENDARRIADVLVDLGGFTADHVTVLRAPTPDAVQDALIDLNVQIRTRGEPALLVVYYSGHADAAALHLGDGTLRLDRLEQLVRGSAASFRLLIVDACRSGALTRVKGGSPIPAPTLRLDERLPADGVVVWASSMANEDAQESDDLRGSFFTHALISGLLGAADANGDGAVTLGEAYPHAYEATLRATSRTLAGTQHATFRHEMHGLSDVVLTWLKARARGVLAIPAGRDYLVMQGESHGAVVADVGARDAGRQVSLRPGTYFVRGRASGHLLEGSVAIRAGERTFVDERALDRVEYARLVRKGAGERARADRVELGYTVRSSLWSSASACHGAMLGWAIDLPWLSLAVRGLGCRGTSDRYLDAAHDQLAAELRAVRAWDAGRVALSGGVVLGAALLSQRFDADDHTSRRTAAAGVAGLTAAVSYDLAPRTYVTFEIDGVTAFFRQEQMADNVFRAAFALRGNVLVGARW
jgi:Caspase domain